MITNDNDLALPLPDEMLCEIYAFLPAEWAAMAARVSSSWSAGPQERHTPPFHLRVPRALAVGRRARLSLGGNLCCCSCWQQRAFALVEKERIYLARRHVCCRSKDRQHGDAAVAARGGLPLGLKAHAERRQQGAIWRPCGGFAKRDVIGTRTPAMLQLPGDTWRSQGRAPGHSQRCEWSARPISFHRTF